MKIEISAGEEQKDKTTDYTRINGKAIKLADLLDAGILEEGEPLEWVRPQKGEHYKARVLPNGSIELADGRKFSSPSRAAMEKQQTSLLSMAGPLGRCREWARNSTVFARIFMTQ